MIADAPVGSGHEGRRRRPARPGQRIDDRQHGDGAIRDRHAADEACAQDRQARMPRAPGGARVSRSMRSPRGSASFGVPDVVRRDTLYLAGNVLDAEGLAREHDARRAAGLASRFLDRRALHARFGIARAGGDCSAMAISRSIRARRRCALLRAAVRQGAAIYAPVDIVDIDARTSGVTATAPTAGASIARQLVFATGYELPDSVPRRATRSSRPGRSRRCHSRAGCGRRNA